MRDAKAGLCACCVGAIGLVLHGALATVSTPVLYNHFAALWFAALLVLAGSDVALTSVAGAARSRSRAAYFGACACACAVAAVCYAIDLRFDITAWALLQLALLAAAARSAALGSAPPAAGATSSAGMSDLHARTDQPARARPRLRACLHTSLRGAHLLLLLVLAYGSVIAAYAKGAHPAEGEVASVDAGGGRALRLHYHCVGPARGSGAPGVAGSAPPIWIASSPAHGVADFLGLQHFLSARGWRACSFDPPGFDHSSREHGAFHALQAYLPPLVRAVEGEGARVVLAAWGGGGSGVAAVAKAGSLPLAAVVFIAVSPPDLEWTAQQRARGLTDAQTEAYREAQLAARESLARTILGLAVPWGLMPAFVPLLPPPPRFHPQAKYGALRVAAWRPSMWVSQYWGIRHMRRSAPADDPLYAVGALPSAVPLAAVLCRLSGEQPCARRAPGRDLEGAACAEAKLRAGHELSEQQRLARRLDRGARLLYNTADHCSLALPVEEPKWTANAVSGALEELLSR